MKLKQGNVAIITPLACAKDPVWKSYTIEHPAFPVGSFVDAADITVSKGRVIGMSPALARQLGVATAGDVQGLTARNAARAAEQAAEQAATAAQAARLGAALGTVAALRAGRITTEQANERLNNLAH